MSIPLSQRARVSLLFLSLLSIRHAQALAERGMRITHHKFARFSLKKKKRNTALISSRSRPRYARIHRFSSISSALFAYGHRRTSTSNQTFGLLSVFFYQHSCVTPSRASHLLLLRGESKHAASSKRAPRQLPPASRNARGSYTRHSAETLERLAIRSVRLSSSCRERRRRGSSTKGGPRARYVARHETPSA